MKAHVAIVGLMGAGKTTAGPLVAERLGVAFVDLDDLFCAQHGFTPADAIRNLGEAEMREMEADVLGETLARDERHVVGTGGGVVLSAANRELLSSRAVVVWMKGPLEVLAKRARTGDRPLLGADPLASLRRLEAERSGCYAEIADVIIDVGVDSPAEVAEKIVAAIAPDSGVNDK